MNKEIVELSKGFFEIYDFDEKLYNIDGFELKTTYHDENIEIEFPQIKGCFVNDNKYRNENRYTRILC